MSDSGQNVLIIGAGTSSVDIAKDIGPFAKNIYQSSREGLFDLPVEMLPENARRVAAVSSYDLPSGSSSTYLGDTEPIPSTVTLANGEILRNIDRVVLATGYHCSFPFLPQLHRDDLSPETATDTVLVTDGTQMHNLHLDIFYIPDPSLAFVGVPYFTATFSLFDFQAIALARIFAGKAELPREEEMRAEYRERVKAKGHGKAFHSLLGQGKEIGYVDSLVEIVNAGVDGKGVPEEEKMTGHSRKWLAGRKIFEERARKGGLVMKNAPDARK
jgi:ACS family pantothenate transporter-like MFS transporter